MKTHSDGRVADGRLGRRTGATRTTRACLRFFTRASVYRAPTRAPCAERPAPWRVDVEQAEFTRGQWGRDTTVTHLRTPRLPGRAFDLVSHGFAHLLGRREPRDDV